MSSDKTIIKKMRKYLNYYEASVDKSIHYGFGKEFINETKFLIDFSLKNIIFNFKKFYSMDTSVYPVFDLMKAFKSKRHIEDLMEALLHYNAIVLRRNILFNIEYKKFRHPRCSHSSYPVNAAIKFFDQNDSKDTQVLVFLCDKCKKFIEYYKKYHNEYELENLLFYSSFHPLNYCTFM